MLPVATRATTAALAGAAFTLTLVFLALPARIR